MKAIKEAGLPILPNFKTINLALPVEQVNLMPAKTEFPSLFQRKQMSELIFFSLAQFVPFLLITGRGKGFDEHKTITGNSIQQLLRLLRFQKVFPIFALNGVF